MSETCTKCGSEMHLASECNSGLCEEMGRLRTRLQQVESERDKAKADAAVMRDELLKLKITEHTKSPCDEYDSHYAHLCPVCVGIDKSLATNAGKSLLLRLREAEEKVEFVLNYRTTKVGMFPYSPVTFSGKEILDTFLNPKPQDVM